MSHPKHNEEVAMATAVSESRETQKKYIRKALRVKPQTAAEIADRIGRGHSARGLGRTLGIMVNDGEAVLKPGRVNAYVRP
jgi:hypothetical protein